MKPTGPPTRSKKYRLSWAQGLAAIFVIAAALRAIYWYQIGDTPYLRVLVGDGYGYDRWARKIAAGAFLGDEVFYQAPLYPYLLAATYIFFGPQQTAIRLIQLILGAASSLLIAGSARVFFSARVGLLSGLLFAIYAPAIFYGALIQKASLSVFLVALLFYATAKALDPLRQERPNRVWLFVAGLVLALASLTRENTLVLIPVIIIWLLVPFPKASYISTRWRQRAWMVAALGAGLFVIFAPVVLRNAYISQRGAKRASTIGVSGSDRGHRRDFFLTTAQFGPNFFIGNAVGADGTYRPLLSFRGSVLHEREDAKTLAQNALGRPLSSAEISRYWTSRTLQDIAADPGRWLKLMLKKLLLVVNAHELADTETPEVYRAESALLNGLWLFVHFGTLAPLAVLGLVTTRRRWRELFLLYASAGAIVLAVAFFYVFGRYRFPLVVLLLPFAAAGLHRLGSRLRQGIAEIRAAGRPKAARVRAFAGAAAVIVSAALLVNADRLPADKKRGRSVLGYYNSAVALQWRGDIQQAAALYRRALAAAPNFAPAAINLSAIKLRAGDLEDAERLLRRAVRHSPGAAMIYFNLGELRRLQGRYDDALIHYREALKRDPQLDQARDAIVRIGRMRP